MAQRMDRLVNDEAMKGIEVLKNFGLLFPEDEEVVVRCAGTLLGFVLGQLYRHGPAAFYPPDEEVPNGVLVTVTKIESEAP